MTRVSLDGGSTGPVRQEGQGAMMEKLNHLNPNPGKRPSGLPDGSEVTVRCGSAALKGILSIPPGAKAVVLFAYGSGSSSRNGFVARRLNEGGLATLLFDLLSLGEPPQTSELGIDLDLLTEHLVGAIDWLETNDTTPGMPVGLFGSGTSAAAALAAAAHRPSAVKAVVSRGGRPELAGDLLFLVKAPTLLLVGGRDLPVIMLNEQARRRMSVKPKLEIVPGASHFFEEPGALEEVSSLACRWFQENLAAGSP